MGIFGEIRREFIARPDQAKGQILYKWPDTNVRKLTQLTVQQDELAVFFRDGRVQGTINPGRCTLDSSEIPFLGMLVDAASTSMPRNGISELSSVQRPGLTVPWTRPSRKKTASSSCCTVSCVHLRTLVSGHL